MIFRIFIGAVLSAIVGFAWGFVFWVGLGSGERLMQPLPAEQETIAALVEAGLATGMYAYPYPADMNDEAAMEAAEQMHVDGPKLQLAYNAVGGPSMPVPDQYLRGLGHYFGVGLVAAIILAMARNALPGYGQRVLLVVLLGLLTAIWSDGADAVWFHHPINYAVGRGIETLVTALLIGLVLAAIIKPAAQAVDQTPAA